MNCRNCLDSGHACDDHPERPWAGVVDDLGCPCGSGIGRPCPSCSDPIPEDGTGSITEAFVPRHLRRRA